MITGRALPAVWPIIQGALMVAAQFADSRIPLTN